MGKLLTVFNLKTLKLSFFFYTDVKQTSVIKLKIILIILSTLIYLHKSQS